ncbi:glutamate--cysteine ligase [Crocosphaera sp. UHCC 0190]|uniref:glutamate--cysteine ligase n=1 Tax=Crocosphaera sp. UHCC 0190 TaxID=3110246 RepID=UPI002B1FE818|nr:glutamate--cysteine ligase [Crocosphaera sp. UHCC 0190]MEA5511661.1 glutamate--cysteine ligase [Crocosphaera sp. UHCC 0190]
MVRLSKGVEVEMYTGTPQGEIIGLSDHITKDLNGFVREPDSRNVEYTTAPLSCYDRLLCSLVRPRRNLRQYLEKMGDYTLIPGSTLSLGDSQQFYRSDPQNPYHTYIEQTYGTKVVTASVHINIGISDPEVLMRACRLVRVEAPLYLALSASSPFLDGQATGYHSTRWQMFPQTPSHVPFFESHAHFIHWTEEQLRLKTMQNVRHLWMSVRPNGDNRPYNLNRLELRICDLIVDPIALLAVIALLEARLLQLIDDPTLDPLSQSQLSPETLLEITDKNEMAVAQQSLDASLYHWQDGRSILAKEWIEQLYQTVWPSAKQGGFSCFLTPIKKILRDGNLAQQWLQKHDSGQSISSIVTQEIASMAQFEAALEDKLCDALFVA